MARFAMELQYNGSDYYGWQSQLGFKTVQASVEQALSRVADHPIQVICAGRTDRGVHALGQVIHFDTESVRALHAWHRGANAYLPSDIAINWVHPVSNDFHARFSARSREYRYLIYNHDSRPAMMHQIVKWEYRLLDLSRMQKAADHLLGEHDFSSFRGSDCQAKTPIRTIHELTITRRGLIVCVTIKANAFLLHMVRNLVGTLLRVGVGLESSEWVKAVLQARDRREAGMTIPAAGLSLVKVNYEAHFALPTTVSADVL
jgi:tRNA pseudouridine38-40 synthase